MWPLSASVILDCGGVSTLCCSNCGGSNCTGRSIICRIGCCACIKSTSSCLLSICGERFYVRGGCRKTIISSNRLITAWERQGGTGSAKDLKLGIEFMQFRNIYVKVLPTRISAQKNNQSSTLKRFFFCDNDQMTVDTLSHLLYDRPRTR